MSESLLEARAEEAEAKLARAMALLGDARVHLGEDDGTYVIHLPADWCPRVLALLEDPDA